MFGRKRNSRVKCDQSKDVLARKCDVLAKTLDFSTRFCYDRYIRADILIESYNYIERMNIMEKEFYTPSEMEIVSFEVEDAITTSLIEDGDTD